MSIKFKLGTTVKQIVPVIQGVVTEALIVEGEVRYCVKWTDADGVERDRFFDESHIEAAE